MYCMDSLPNWLYKARIRALYENLHVFVCVCVCVCACSPFPFKVWFLIKGSCHNHSVLRCVAVCCSVLQCVAVCCSVLWLLVKGLSWRDLSPNCLILRFSGELVLILRFSRELVRTDLTFLWRTCSFLHHIQDLYSVKERHASLF